MDGVSSTPHRQRAYGTLRSSHTSLATPRFRSGTVIHYHPSKYWLRFPTFSHESTPPDLDRDDYATQMYRHDTIPHNPNVTAERLSHESRQKII